MIKDTPAFPKEYLHGVFAKHAAKMADAMMFELEKGGKK